MRYSRAKKNVKKLLKDAVVEEGWDSKHEEWCYYIPRDLFDNIIEHLIHNEENENG